MAAFGTHLLVAVFVGLVLRVPARYLPLCALAGVVMDADNLFFLLEEPDPPWLRRRGGLQNLFVFVLLPTLAAAAVFLADRFEPGVERLAAAVPAATGAHMLHDLILPIPPYEWAGGLTLLFPFSRARWTFDVTGLATWDTRLFDGFALMLLVLLPLVLASWILTSGIERDEAVDVRRARVAAFAFCYLVVLPTVVLLAAHTTGA